MATTAMLELRSIGVSRHVYDREQTFRVHLARPGANPLWRFSDGAEGSATGEEWEALVLELGELEAERVADGLDEDGGGQAYLDGETTVVTFQFFDGKTMTFRVEPAAPPDPRRDAVIRAIDDFAKIARRG